MSRRNSISKSYAAAHGSAASAIYCPENNQRQNLLWISSIEFDQCDLIDNNIARTFPNQFLSIFQIAL
jgi:hypothetical protein